MEYPNASGVPANMLPRSDVTAFEQLKWLLDREAGEISPAPKAPGYWQALAWSKAGHSHLLRMHERSQ
ncbi:MAG: hypothetical protein R3D05_18260 [Dongiaceae bacterium]